jgi:hypothetical protein
VVVIDLANFLYILKNYIPPRPQTVPDRFEFIDCDGKTWTWETTHVFAMPSFPEISSLARAAGFVDPRTYRSLLSRHEENLDGPRIVFSARKPLNAGVDRSGRGPG